MFAGLLTNHDHAHSQRLSKRDKETERDGGKEGRRKRVTNGSLSLSLSEI
jgi:hypothetical protein